MTEKKIVTVEFAKHGNPKLNSITGMLSKVLYTMNVVSAGRVCVLLFGVIDKTRVTVEPVKHGNPKRNSITEMLRRGFYSTIVVSVNKDTVGIVMLTIARQLWRQTMNGIVER